MLPSVAGVVELPHPEHPMVMENRRSPRQEAIEGNGL